MDKCKSYFSGVSKSDQSSLSEESVENLPEVKPSQIIKLAS